MNRGCRIAAIAWLPPLLALAGCRQPEGASTRTAAPLAPTPTAAATPARGAPSATTAGSEGTPPVARNEMMSALQDNLARIYETVNPSVVNIQVVQKQEALGPGYPFGVPQGPQEFYRQGGGSGFVWDDQGHLVTNNHVVANADRISATFSDGAIVSGEVVGADPDSDLAVVRVDLPADRLKPVQVADSGEVRVGELAIAIGNPFGLEGTMTVGFVSALGRLLPLPPEGDRGPGYSIPDMIQTDASINPGNSGGVLVDDEGRVIGVTSAIISAAGSSAGVGFAIPSAIVQKVVPALIQTGRYEHPWLGISGTTLAPDLAEQMGLAADKRGGLVVDVTPGGPADKAGLRGSDQQVTIDGMPMRVGGDVIVAIDGQPVKSFDDVIAHLARHTQVGQTLPLQILRGGRERTLEVTLRARPRGMEEIRSERRMAGRAWLGIIGLTLTPEIAHATGLSPNQQGVLVAQVAQGSPADKAGLQGGYKPVVVNGERLLAGGDILTAVNGEPLAHMEELVARVQQSEPGQTMEFAMLRNGKQEKVPVTLEPAPGPR